MSCEIIHPDIYFQKSNIFSLRDFNSFVHYSVRFLDSASNLLFQFQFRQIESSCGKKLQLMACGQIPWMEKDDLCIPPLNRILPHRGFANLFSSTIHGGDRFDISFRIFAFPIPLADIQYAKPAGELLCWTFDKLTSEYLMLWYLMNYHFNIW